MLRTDLLTFGVTGAVFKIAGEMRRLLAHFDNPAATTLVHRSRAVVAYDLFWCFLSLLVSLYLKTENEEFCVIV